MVSIAFMPFVIFLVLGALTIIGGTIVLLYIIKAVKGPRMDDEDARVMQELYDGMEKMGRRVEALETLLLDAERKDENS